MAVNNEPLIECGSDFFSCHIYNRSDEVPLFCVGTAIKVDILPQLRTLCSRSPVVSLKDRDLELFASFNDVGERLVVGFHIFLVPGILRPNREQLAGTRPGGQYFLTPGCCGKPPVLTLQFSVRRPEIRRMWAMVSLNNTRGPLRVRLAATVVHKSSSACRPSTSARAANASTNVDLHPALAASARTMYSAHATSAS